MRIHLHDYRRVRTNGILDGAVLMHCEMADLIARSSDTVSFHDVTNGPSCIDTVGEGETVYAGLGPYAYLYHLWRERANRSFPIVREVHTSFWSGYWTQEELCAPYVRQGDLVLFPTEYTRQLYIKHFASITEDNSAVAYPILHRLPPRQARHRPKPLSTQSLRIGYIGALSEAKNFDQVLAVFLDYYRQSGGRAVLSFAGKPNHPRWEQAAVCDSLVAGGVARAALRPRGVLSTDEIGSFYEDCDVVLFPSTASRETLGRVILEAIAHGTPILAADLGPAPELVDEESLIHTTLHYADAYRMDAIVPLGRIDVNAAVALLMERDFHVPELPDESLYSADRFIGLLRHTTNTSSKVEGWDRKLIDHFVLTERPAVRIEDWLNHAEQLFLWMFGDSGQRRKKVAAEIETAEHIGAEEREKLKRIVEASCVSLADYRGLPRIIDALVMKPLSYAMAEAPVASH